MPYKKVLKNSVLKKITDHIVFKRFEYLNESSAGTIDEKTKVENLESLTL